MGDLWPLLRSASRKLALFGWASCAAGVAAGLAVAVASGTSLSPVMLALQEVSSACMGLAVVSFTAAVLLQPHLHLPQRRGDAPSDEAGDTNAPSEAGIELPSTLRSFLPGALVLLIGAISFAAAGLVLRSGPSPQSLAFCQVFVLSAAASGFTYLLFSRVAPRSENGGPERFGGKN